MEARIKEASAFNEFQTLSQEFHARYAQLMYQEGFMQGQLNVLAQLSGDALIQEIDQLIQETINAIKAYNAHRSQHGTSPEH